MNLKIGDPVICYKPIWMDKEWRRGIILKINWYPGLNNNNVHFYVIRIGKDTFNIFPHNESIILDKQTLREGRLKELGI